MREISIKLDTFTTGGLSFSQDYSFSMHSSLVLNETGNAEEKKKQLTGDGSAGNAIYGLSPFLRLLNR